MYNKVDRNNKEETTVNFFRARMLIICVVMFRFFDRAFSAPSLGTGLRCLMFAHMNFIQVRTVEGHATVRAYVRFLPSVGLLVSYKTRFGCQAHGTI